MVVLIRVTIAVGKHHKQRNLWRKGFIGFLLPHPSASSKEIRTRTQVRTRTQAGQKPRGFSLACYHWLSQSSFFIELKAISPGMTQP